MPVFVEHWEDTETKGIQASNLWLGADISNICKSKWEPINKGQVLKENDWKQTYLGNTESIDYFLHWK